MAAYQRWWLDRMSATRFPLEEKLTLYWHNHFATGFSKVRRPKAMLAQNRLLRDHAGGNFRALCNAITADPAMLIWLDGNTNQKIQPNENYGREFMELFTLGPRPLHPGGRAARRPGPSPATPPTARAGPCTTPSSTTTARRRSSARRASGARPT